MCFFPFWNRILEKEKLSAGRKIRRVFLLEGEEMRFLQGEIDRINIPSERNYPARKFSLNRKTV